MFGQTDFQQLYGFPLLHPRLKVHNTLRMMLALYYHWELSILKGGDVFSHNVDWEAFFIRTRIYGYVC